MFLPLVQSLGDNAEIASAIILASGFDKYYKNREVIDKIKERSWDYVVLQEQSSALALPTEWVDEHTTPYAIELNRLVHEANPAAKTIYFVTWGGKDGDSANCGLLPEVCGYNNMQERLIAGYARLAEKTSGALSPVGQAWSIVMHSHPDINLYEDDGRHPSAQGAYLAACVFYAVLFQKKPLGASPLDIPEHQARELQEAASAAVFNRAPEGK